MTATRVRGTAIRLRGTAALLRVTADRVTGLAGVPAEVVAAAFGPAGVICARAEEGGPAASVGGAVVAACACLANNRKSPRIPAASTAT